jgi:UDP-3-O-[3-hydroxymyristoyl] glucosamine N-acyltransferase
MKNALTIDNLLAAVAALEPTLSAHCFRTDGRGFQGFKPITQACVNDWVFFNDLKLLKHLSHCQAGGVVISKDNWDLYQASISADIKTVIICQYPYAFFALAAQILAKHQQTYQINIDNVDNVDNVDKNISHHPTVQIHPTAKIGKNVVIQAFVSIGANSIIGDNAVIHPHCSISDDVVIGEDTIIYSNVNLYHGVVIGKRCIIHAGTVIGSDGFGFAPYQKRWLKIPQTGTVIIANDVEIGANCTIDRGALGDTIIGQGTKLDNLIQIAHNVIVGEHCAFASGVGIAGSAVLGNRIQVGGKAGILGHLSICDDVVISSFTLVTKTIHRVGFYTGVYPIQENNEWEKNAVVLKRLFNLREQVKALEKL